MEIKKLKSVCSSLCNHCQWHHCPGPSLYLIRWVCHVCPPLVLICIWYDEFLTTRLRISFTIPHLYLIRWDLTVSSSKLSTRSHRVNQSLAVFYLTDFCRISLTLHHKDRLYWIRRLVLPFPVDIKPFSIPDIGAFVPLISNFLPHAS